MSDENEIGVVRVVLYREMTVIQGDWRARVETDGGEVLPVGVGHNRVEDALRSIRGLVGSSVPVYRETISADGRSTTISLED